MMRSFCGDGVQVLVGILGLPSRAEGWSWHVCGTGYIVGSGACMHLASCVGLLSTCRQGGPL
jgi:hypothetical protein